MGNRARIAATVVWEDCDRPNQHIYFETTSEFADDLFCNPDAFALACFAPAVCNGEKRLYINTRISPNLREGLLNAMEWFYKWYDIEPLHLESQNGLPHREPSKGRTGAFLSGGVDSLAMLRGNQMAFPKAHSAAIQDGILVYGFDIGGYDEGEEIENYERAYNALQPIAQEAQLSLIPIFTNIRHLDTKTYPWRKQYHGAALAAVAHALSRRFARVSIASSVDIRNVGTHGSHPLLLLNYSTTGLQLRHEQARYSRFDKAQLLADWPTALRHLRVCTLNPEHGLNCGTCEKCLRTMLELLAVGKLHETDAFGAHDITSDMVQDIHLYARTSLVFYGELIPHLEAQGRDDLVEVLEKKLADLEKQLMWENEEDWKGAVKRFDRRYLGGNLFRAYSATRTALGKGNSHAS
jgi:hypothetical protein